jgi:hypothetical protein
VGEQAVLVGSGDAGEVQVVVTKAPRRLGSVLDQHSEGSRLHGVVCDLGGDGIGAYGDERPRRSVERQLRRQCRGVDVPDPQLDVVTRTGRKRVGVEVTHIDGPRVDTIVD